MEANCTHLDQIDAKAQPKTPEGCEECLASNQPWNELRMCLTCGHIGCCDNSFGKHATAHFKSTGHPIMAGYKTPSAFKWCYIDEVTLD